MAELLLFLVEQCCEFAYEFGVDDEPFYESIEKNYRRFLEFSYKHKLLDKFKSRAINVADVTQYISFNEQMCEIVSEFYFETQE